MQRLNQLRGLRVYLDTNFFIYAIESTPEYETTVTFALDMIDARVFHAVTSELTLGEALVKPLQTGNTLIAEVYRTYIQPRPTLRVAAITRDIVVESAQCRAKTGMNLLDSIHVATALAEECDAVLTNDRGFRPYGALKIVYLSS